ncbi:MAG TPA: MBL fold metallo-hydrolase [Candidatus Baltobacteraceae bacterium]|jgi:glyoxylase-like metal-dependent hydrolase (beta-lactamase superfamily II)|nr:MBL fold metallo-hydrolase [Candidatus Baltobacteraceae bacterium]
MVELSSRVLRLRAPNPSPLTLDGTNTYLLLADERRAVVIDPGPDDSRHITRIVRELEARGLVVSAIAVTHGHPDHAPGAATLHRLTNAPVYAHTLARFPHDHPLADGETLRLGTLELTAIDAPGHSPDHLVFWLAEEGMLFTGDVVIGRGSVVIAPPDGEMRTYQRTLERLRTDFGHARTILGGHGERIDDPKEKLDEYIAHRKQREDQIRAALREKPLTLLELVSAVYPDLDSDLLGAAARQISAYLIALEREGEVRTENDDGTSVRYVLKFGEQGKPG